VNFFLNISKIFHEIFYEIFQGKKFHEILHHYSNYNVRHNGNAMKQCHFQNNYGTVT